MIIDGKKISSEILSSVQENSRLLGRELVIRAVVVEPNPATESYLRTKVARGKDAGMHVEVVRLAENADTEDVLNAVRAPGADAVIVQLPLPSRVSEELILDEIPLEKDADVLSTAAYEQFSYGETDALLPPVVLGVQEILTRAGVDVKNKIAVVVGAGKLVGQPIASWLEEQGANVEVVTLTQGSLTQLQNADIVITGAGSPHLIKPEMLKKGVVLIDGGTSESNGAIMGDTDPACVAKASVYSPVPGGLGPIVVACLFKNTATLALRAQSKQ